jgi:membrane protein YqaA with SNARE-associated domain
MSELVDRIRALALALGGPGLFLVAFLDSSFLPLPGITDVLLVITVTRRPAAMLFYVAMTVVGSVVGCLALHYLGRKGGEAFVRKKFTGEKIEHALATLRRNGVLAVLVPCLLPPPSPFKIFILLAGVVGISATRPSARWPLAAAPTSCGARHRPADPERAGHGVRAGEGAALNRLS